jgi:2-oxoglutarate ferredoxin oxidoreductase subunit beta
MSPIDPVLLGLGIGATFIARSFSGDKEQLVPILKAAIAHRGFAIVDVISPCVTFNDHEGSTKSYLYTRQHELKATETDFVPPATEILAQIGQNGAVSVTMHDGSILRFKGVPQNYDPTNREKVFSYIEEHNGKGVVVTGLLYVNESVPDLHEMNQTAEIALTKIPYEKLCPGVEALDRLQEDFR